MSAQEEFTAKNKAYFNDLATKYDSKFGETLDRLQEQIGAAAPFIGLKELPDEPVVPVRLLDYACGTGLVTRSLAPYFTQCVGIDLAPGMVGVYNTKAENQGLYPDEMFAVEADLLKVDDEDPVVLRGEKFRGFDVAAIGLGAHHFDDPVLAVRRLVDRLNVGGTVIIIDFLENDGNIVVDQRGVETVKYHGFTNAQITQILTDGGAGGDVEVKILGKALKFHGHGAGLEGQDRRVFMARGRKI